MSSCRADFCKISGTAEEIKLDFINLIYGQNVFLNKALIILTLIILI